MDDESDIQASDEQVMDDQPDTAGADQSDDSDDTVADDSASADDGIDESRYVSREKYENLQKALHEARQKGKAQGQPASQSTPPARQYDPSDLSDVMNADGSIDPIRYAQRIQQDTLRQAEARRAEERDWERAIKEYPELEQDADLAEAVRGLRDRKMVLEGEFLSYADAAKRIVTRFKDTEAKAKEAGRKEAQVSETIQRRATIDRPSNVAEDSDAQRVAELKERMRKGTNKERDAARIELLALQNN
jgi:hypothetical protein